MNMFPSYRRQPSESFRAGKTSSSKKRSSFRATSSRRYEQAEEQATQDMLSQRTPLSAQTSPTMSAIVTISVGPAQRLFAAHEDVLAHSPLLASLCQAQFFAATGSAKRVDLPDELPEIFSCLLEYMYKGDYFPRLEYDKRRRSYVLEDATAEGPARAAVDVEVLSEAGEPVRVLKDSVIYCAGLKYGLPGLQKLALRKQGLQSGVSCATILASARYAYAHTPDTDSRLRAHYLALIVRSRSTFKRSGTMQAEMERGGRMFFDLFVAMVNHIDELSDGDRMRS